MMTIKETKELELRRLKSRRNIIMSRGKTTEDQGVFRKINRKIRKVEQEINSLC